MRPRNRLSTSGLLAAILLGALHHPLRAATTSIENERLRIELDATNGLRLTQILSKGTGRNLIQADAGVPLYLMDIYQGGKLAAVSPGKDDAILVRRIDSHGLEAVVHHAKYKLTVIVSVSLPRGARTASFSLRLERGDRSWRPGLVRYPGFAADIDGGQHGAVLLSVADGEVIDDPVRNIADGETREYPYPGIASGQLLAAYDNRGGLLAYAADPTGQFKVLAVRRVGRGIAPFFEHVLYNQDQEKESIPYPVEVGDFSGPWEEAADVYKAWAVHQPWCRARLEDRVLPKSVSDPSFVLGINLREEAKNGGNALNRIPEVPDFIDGWSKGLGLPVTALLLSWEKNGPWIAPEYFPPFGGKDAFARMVQGLQAKGDHAMAYLSGLNFTLEKTPRHGAGYFKSNSSDLGRAMESAVVGQNGQPLIQGSPQEGTGKRIVLCPYTPFARQELAQSFRAAHDLGLDFVQVDQVVGGGVPPCFSTRHNHPPVGGSWMFESIDRELDSLRGQFPTTVISLEEPGELYLQTVQIFHTREYVQGFWPRDRKGVRGVPLFAYLYHEFGLGYGGDSAPIATDGEDSTVALYAQAMNLISGRYPGAAVWMRMIPYRNVHPAQRRFMQSAAALFSGEAGRYLKFGRIFRLPRQETFEQPLRLSYAGSSMELKSPRLLARGFQAKDGSKVILYINSSGSPLQATLRFSSRDGQSARTIDSENGSVLHSGDSKTLAPWQILCLREEN